MANNINWTISVFSKYLHIDSKYNCVTVLSVLVNPRSKRRCVEPISEDLEERAGNG